MRAICRTWVLMLLAAHWAGCPTGIEPPHEEPDPDLSSCDDCTNPACAFSPACMSPGPDPDPTPSCSCPADQACVAGGCKSVAGALFGAGPERALVLVDRRLYAQVLADLHAYVEAAAGRRSFGIRIVGEAGLDDLSHVQVRELLRQYRKTYPSLEGVVLAGNVAMPTFFMSRIDVPQVRYWPRYYEDLDMIASKKIADGSSLPACSGDGGNGYPANWPCVAPGIWQAPFKVPAHDFDALEQGPSRGRELWVSFWPVGLADKARNTYVEWGNQLRPFLQKALAFYRDPGKFARNLYHVGNDLAMVGQLSRLWPLLGPKAIDYYAINTLGLDKCKNNPACYKRAPLEQHASLDAFLSYAGTLPWIDEGWQDPAVFLADLNSGPAFPRRVVWWNVHSDGTESIISATQARQKISAGKGGLVGLLNGCMVGTFTRSNDTPAPDFWPVPAVEHNILVSLVYGPGAFVAATGSLPARTADPSFGTLLDSLYVDAYLGLANRLRMNSVEQGATTTSADWRSHQDILIGDPFVDAR
jgi:hypothetical protein